MPFFEMNQPKVTIITPAFNHERFISQCIKSVLAQTYKNWEQIIIDDASTDETFKIASSFAKKDKRIKIVRHSKNFGIKRLADIYNQALKMSKGEYIAILESDDYWPKDKLKNQVKSFKNKKVVLSFGNCILVNKFGFPIKLFTYKNGDKLLNNRPVGSILNLFYKLNFSIIPVTVMIRKRTLSMMGGFKKNKHYPFTDIPTFLNLAILGESRFVDDILGFYRKQESSYWFDFASKTPAMGHEEVGVCVEDFVKLNRHNANIKNFEADITGTRQHQFNYLKMKKLTKPLSLFVNKVAFHSKINPMTAVFVFEIGMYKIKKLFFK